MTINAPFAPTTLNTLCLLLVLIGGCVPLAQSQEDERISIVGDVTVRGQQPFAEYVLETDSGTYYVLRFAEQTSDSLSTPARLRVSGRLYADDWDGRPFAHIDVTDWERSP